MSDGYSLIKHSHVYQLKLNPLRTVVAYICSTPNGHIGQQREEDRKKGGALITTGSHQSFAGTVNSQGMLLETVRSAHPWETPTLTQIKPSV